MNKMNKTIAELLIYIGTDEGIVLDKNEFNIIINQLTDIQKQAIKDQCGGSAPVVVDITLTNPKVSTFISWSIYEDTSAEDPDDWVEDYSIAAPDGVYTVRFDYLDKQFGERHGVQVKDGMVVNPEETLELVGQARNEAGYWGTFLERLEFDGKKITARIGS